MSKPSSLFPPAAKTLTGGCFCTAIRYTISIPEASARPSVPDALPTPIPPLHHAPLHRSTSSNPSDVVTDRLTEPQTSTPLDPSLGSDVSQSKRTTTTQATPTRHPSATPTLLPTTYPILEFDHCTSCRRACGSIVQCWLVIPLSWVTFHLLRRSAAALQQQQQSGTGTDAHHDTVQVSAREVLLPTPALQTQTHVAHYTSNNASHRPFCSRCGTPFGFYWFDRASPVAERHGGDGGDDGAAVGEGGEGSEVDIFDIAAGTLDTACLALLGGDGDGDGDGDARGSGTDTGADNATGEGKGIGIGIQRHSHWDSGVGWIKKALYRGWGGVRHPGGLPVAVVEEDRKLLGL